MQLLKFDEFKNLAEESNRVAVFAEASTSLTPEIIYDLLAPMFGAGVIFEDLYADNKDRYSYLSFEPIASLTVNDYNPNLLDDLRKIQNEQRHKTRESIAQLITNSFGFLTYDAVRCFEKIPDRHVKKNLPICFFNFYAMNVTFDHQKRSILISYIVSVDNQPEHAYIKAKEKIATVISLLNVTVPLAQTEILNNTIDIGTDTSDAEFVNKIERAKDYIIRGDAFQIVISRSFQTPYSVTPFAIYRSLRQVSPAPFMFYFPTASCIILGASPERLISVRDNIVSINPIAGTRKHSNQKSMSDIQQELLTDRKEIAEHMMLVDLARNDVGAVSVPGTVRIEKLLHVKHYSHVSHITSDVEGELQLQYDALDALAAAFPAGTLSGAPKIRSMEIIDELETSSRGLYGGALCRIDSAGNLETCIAIRMAILQDGLATVRAGAGVVYDSNPLAETQETYQKARPILEAICRAHGVKNVINYR